MFSNKFYFCKIIIWIVIIKLIKCNQLSILSEASYIWAFFGYVLAWRKFTANKQKKIKKGKLASKLSCYRLYFFFFFSTWLFSWAHSWVWSVCFRILFACKYKKCKLAFSFKQSRKTKLFIHVLFLVLSWITFCSWI